MLYLIFFENLFSKFNKYKKAQLGKIRRIIILQIIIIILSLISENNFYGEIWSGSCDYMYV